MSPLFEDRTELESLKPDEVSASLSDAEILIVDDSRLMRIILTKALQDPGSRQSAIAT
jgi:hypothetical protein